MKDHPYKDEFAFYKEHYSRRLDMHGDSAEGVHWSNRETQEKRLDILTQVGDLSSAKILDFGCGTGHLLQWLREQIDFRGEYVGYDITSEMVQLARSKFDDARFEDRDVLAAGVEEDFDYILLSGVFHRYSWKLTKTLLKKLFPHARTAMAFNALSSYVDFVEPEHQHHEPERVFSFCKQELSPCVTLRHDYLIKHGVIPYEFTVYVYQTGLEPRKSRKLVP